MTKVYKRVDVKRMVAENEVVITSVTSGEQLYVVYFDIPTLFNQNCGIISFTQVVHEKAVT